MTAVDSIAIEPLTAPSFEVVAAWLATPALNRWLTADWREREATSTVLAIATRQRRNRFFLVRHHAEPCGLVALSDLDPIDKTAMVWYLLGDRRFEGRGITTAAVNQLVSLSFNELGLRSLYAWAMEPNEASIRVLKKTGFREAGRLRQSACLDQTQTDRIYFDLVATEWAPLSNHAVRTPAAALP